MIYCPKKETIFCPLLIFPISEIFLLFLLFIFFKEKEKNQVEKVLR